MGNLLLGFFRLADVRMEAHGAQILIASLLMQILLLCHIHIEAGLFVDDIPDGVAVSCTFERCRFELTRHETDER